MNRVSRGSDGERSVWIPRVGEVAYQLRKSGWRLLYGAGAILIVVVGVASGVLQKAGLKGLGQVTDGIAVAGFALCAVVAQLRISRANKEICLYNRVPLKARWKMKARTMTDPAAFDAWRARFSDPTTIDAPPPGGELPGHVNGMPNYLPATALWTASAGSSPAWSSRLSPPRSGRSVTQAG